MMKVHIELTACILLAFFANFGQCCGPAEIGQQYTITSTLNVPSGIRVLWQLEVATVLYDSSFSNPNTYSNIYEGTRTQLIIKNVSKDDGTRVFKHILQEGSNGIYTCTLPVYTRASIPTCETVTLTGNQIRTTCTTGQVYPPAKCQFTLQNEGTDRRDVKVGTSYITYTHIDPKPPENEFYSTSCTLQYPVDGFKPGNWTVQVNMYPDLTGLSLTNGTVGQAANPIQLSVPTVEIDFDNCPKGVAEEGDTNVRNGYIREAMRASCLCTRAHAGNPPATIRWSSTQGGNFTIMSESENATTALIIAPDNFTCQSSSALDGSHSVSYTPNYAYGPSSASLTLQLPGPIYLCPNQQTNIDITCQVPETSFNPAILFTLTDGNSNNLVTKVAGHDAWTKSVNYNFTKSGPHTFTCRVENVIFSDIISEAPVSPIQVYEPPQEPPVISARSAQYVDTLVVGDDVKVTCKAPGGYPSVQSVTLTCSHNESVTRTGTSAQLTLNNIGLEYNETNCTCQATHITECYDLIGVLPLTVVESNLTISEQEDSLPIGAAVGGAIGAFVVIAVIVGGIFFIRRRMRKKGHPSPEAGGYNPYQDPTAVIKENDLYGTACQDQLPVSAKDYTKVKPTIQSATALPKKYNPENADNPYEDVTPVELNRKSYAKTSQTKPVPGAQPKAPKTSVRTNAVPKPGEHVQGNPSRDSDYAVVVKRKSEHFMSFNLDQTDGSTTDGAAGGMSKISEGQYDQEEIKDLEDGKKKKIKEKPGKKEKEKKEKSKKDKNEKKKKGKDKGMDLVGLHTNGNGEAGLSQDDVCVYSNEAVDRKTDGELYANIGTSKKSSSDVDDGRYTNDTGLVYITLQGVRTAVHHPRKETPVNYADIDYNQIVANREDIAQ